MAMIATSVSGTMRPTQIPPPSELRRDTSALVRSSLPMSATGSASVAP